MKQLGGRGVAPRHSQKFLESESKFHLHFVSTFFQHIECLSSSQSCQENSKNSCLSSMKPSTLPENDTAGRHDFLDFVRHRSAFKRITSTQLSGKKITSLLGNYGNHQEFQEIDKETNIFDLFIHFLVSF